MDWTEPAIPFFLAAVLLERQLARRKAREVYERRDTWASLAMGVGSIGAGALWGLVAWPLYLFFHQHRLFDFGGGAWVFAGALVADDFAYYWFHRLHHEVRVLWASHVPHHSSQRYNLSTALRQSWTPMTAFPFYAPLALLGFDPKLLVTVHSLNLIYQFWIHSELVPKLGPFEWLFNTPSHHRVHHGANVQYLDRNYAGIFIVWDRLFGSFEEEREPVRFGLTKNLSTYNPVRIAFDEFVACFRAALRPNPLRTRLAYLFAPPGWSPDGSTRTAPQLRAAQRSGDVLSLFTFAEHGAARSKSEK
jgi:sterol desaturase/sphingolipid hydroxylase (fatty acid hydroxylase superfamily)